MTTITLLDKVRQGRLDALASLETRDERSSNVVSIFDYAFDEAPVRSAAPASSNVIAFRSHRAAQAETAAPMRRAA